MQSNETKPAKGETERKNKTKYQIYYF